MKCSEYNYYVFTDKGELIYNTIGDSFVFLPSGQTEKLKNLDWNFFTEEQMSSFRKANIIVDDGLDEREFLMKEYNISHKSPVYYLTLLPTLDCNVKCWYCFERLKKGSRLLPNTKDAILKHVEHVMRGELGIRKLAVELFGGEPLLYYQEDLHDLLKEIKKTVIEAGKSFNLLLITNGINLTSKTINLLAEFSPHIQISIDGERNTHNRVKRMPDAPQISVYDKVMENVSELSKLSNVYINVRINYDDNTLPLIPSIIGDLKELDRSKIGIHLERIWQTIKPNEMTDNDVLRNVMLQLLNAGFYVTYMNFFRKGYSCKASKINQAVVSYDGHVYKCTGRNFTDSFSDGFLNDDGHIVWKKEKWEERTLINTYNIDICKECKLLPLCWGPCCQKHLECKINGLKIEDKCQLNHLELPIDEYILFRFLSQINRNKSL